MSVDTEVIEEIRRFKTFVLNRERWKMTGEDPMELKVYRSHQGHLIEARHNDRRPGLVKVIAEREIYPELAARGHGTCSVGKSAKDGKWYGWSHRAMVGFGIGDRIFEESYGDDQTPFVKHGSKPITNDAEARLAACRFARSVS